MSNSQGAKDSFGFGEFGVRLAAALAMVFATWNPSGYSFAGWASSAWSTSSVGALHAFVAVVLLIGWVILLRAAFNSLGMLGLVLGGLLLGATVWLLFDLGVLRGSSTTLFAWIVLVCLAVLLAIGLSWSSLWRQMTGQVDVEDFERR